MRDIVSPLDGFLSPFGALRNSTAAFTPASLFANDEAGIWLDPSDTSTLFQDTAGTTPVTTAGQTVALALEKSQGAGYSGGEFTGLDSELITGDSSTFTSGLGSWTNYTGATATVVDGKFSIPGPGTYVLLGALSVGDTYLIEYDYTRTSASNVPYVGDRAGPGSQIRVAAGALSGAASGIITCAFNQAAIGAASGDVTIDNISVRELPGNHATQSGESFRPQYQTGGLLYDGLDDRMNTPYKPTTSGTIIAKFNGDTASKVIAGSQPASDGRCFLALDASGRLAAGIGAQSTATIVDQEAGRRNLLSYTEDFDNAVWVKRDVTVTANTFGTFDTVTPDSTGSDNRKTIRTGFVILADSTTVTIQCKVRPNGYEACAIGFSNGTGVVTVMRFGLSGSGSLGTAQNFGGSSYVSGSGTIIANDDGTYSISARFVSPEGAVDMGVEIAALPTVASSITGFDGDGVSGVDFGEIQLEEGSTATAYQPVLGATLNDLRGSTHIGAVTWDGSTVKLYLDGVEVYSAAQSGAVNTTVDMMLGALNANGTAAAFWDNIIADHIILDRAMTPAEITNLTNLWSD